MSVRVLFSHESASAAGGAANPPGPTPSRLIDRAAGLKSTLHHAYQPGMIKPMRARRGALLLRMIKLLSVRREALLLRKIKLLRVRREALLLRD